ncbi:beta-N-acetylhexosaminidase [Flavobacteriaceae bacterium]|nr:beta-N-acetylhexosaminidase [Flavobacteriaceae bacterium]
MNKLFSTLLLSIGLLCAGCEPNPKMDLSQSTLIPIPNSVNASGSSFKFDGDLEINITDDLDNLGLQAQRLFQPATGFSLPVIKEAKPSSDQLVLRVDSNLSEQEGAYKLEITERNISITGVNQAAVYNGLETLKQLFPKEIVLQESQDREAWFIPSGIIQDAPRYQYRGAMLDVSRHFFSVEDVKSYIDYLAMYKMNVLHMHLADDQGWRIEIKSWPDLTTKGSVSEVGGGVGGFYTQEEFKELVDYAAGKYIEIIPEIDMPGHINAALHAYPILNPDDEELPYYTGMEVGFSTLNYEDPDTWRFVNDVIRELAEISPSKYIHIGGDETHATSEEDYQKFIPRIVEIVEANDKYAMGWDDVAKAELSQNTVAQLWKPDTKDIMKGLDQGVEIVMSPAKRAYLDMKYDQSTRIGLTWAATIEVDQGYNWDPSSFLEGVNESQIRGMEAALWTETVENMDDLQYLVFPRLTGYGEVSWSRQEDRDWEAYKVRLKKHLKRLDLMNINYYHSPLLEDDEIKK